jgi:hypothetical protein
MESKDLRISIDKVVKIAGYMEGLMDVKIEGRIYSKEECKGIFGSFNPYTDYTDSWRGKNEEELTPREFFSKKFYESVINLTPHN